jgi:hypothetical protein
MIKYFFQISLLMALCACSEKEEIYSTPVEEYAFLSTYKNISEPINDESCLSEIFIVRLENLTGEIKYDPIFDRYVIQHHIPGTIDSRIYGILCESKSEFERLSSILFSASVYEYSGMKQPGIGGVKFFVFREVEINSK